MDQPPTDEHWLQYLDPACFELQKLHKKLRNWRNKGFASEQDLKDCTAALEAVRAIFRRHDLRPEDIDGRIERRKRQQ